MSKDTEMDLVACSMPDCLYVVRHEENDGRAFFVARTELNAFDDAAIVHVYHYMSSHEMLVTRELI